jgi:hypothetical protein
MPLVLLVSLSSCRCDYVLNNFTGEHTYTYEMEASSEICLNITNPPVALVGLSLPSDSNILFYDEKTGNCSLFLDFAAQSRDLPFAMRS